MALLRSPRACLSAHHLRRGISLAELLIVLGIIIVLVAIALPTISKTRQSAMAVQCRAQLHQIGQAIAAYGAMNRGRLPHEHPGGPFPRYWPELLFRVSPPAPFLTAHLVLLRSQLPKVLTCPTATDDSEKLSYLMNSWLVIFRVQLHQKFRQQHASEIVLLGENRRGRQDLFHILTDPASYDLARHGPALRTNYLWFDLHVSSDLPKPPPGAPDDFFAMPASW